MIVLLNYLFCYLSTLCNAVSSIYYICLPIIYKNAVININNIRPLPIR